jgi:16S rRNA (uracil1498-N3)-methyltransferase
MLERRHSTVQRRLFAPELPSGGGEVVLPPESAHHAHVLRLAVGDRVTLFDGRAGEATATITAFTRDALSCDATARVAIARPSPALHVVLGLPKGGKLEDITRMLTELGANELHVALTERSVPRPKDAAARMARLQRVTLQACAQSGQACALELHAPAPLLEVAGRAPLDALRLVFWEGGGAQLDAAIAAGAAHEVWAVVGPEGGLSVAEVEALRVRGFASVGLGRALLRVETAAPVIAALLLDRLGRLQAETE